MEYPELIRRLNAALEQGPQAERICTQLLYLDAVSAAENGKYNGAILAAGRRVLEQGFTPGAVAAAEAELMPLQPAARQYTALFMAHAHIDMNWQWGFQETTMVTLDTFRTMLDLMNDYPQFTFSQSQASVYRIVEETSPDLLEEIRARVKEGRWEVTASHWVEADKNLPDGESLTRQMLYTKNYLGGLFGLPDDYFTVDFEPDTFGYNANVPEILAEGGVKYLFHFRGHENYSRLYNFRAPSGRQVLAARPFSGYSSPINARALYAAPLYCAQHGVKVYPYLYGVGDHGGGPTRRDVEKLLAYQSWPLTPTVRFGTWHEFFAAVEGQRDAFPVWQGQIEQLFTGCYTSQARIKAGNRLSEARMNEAELLSASACLLAGAQRRNAVLEPAWRDLLFNQFHDILPGSGTPDTVQHATGKYQDVLGRIFPVSGYAMRKLAAAIDTSSIPEDADTAPYSEGKGIGIGQSPRMGYRQPAPERGRGTHRILHFFNPTRYPRKEVVEFTLWDYSVNLFDAEMVDDKGRVIPFIVVSEGYAHGANNTTAVLQALVEVPALGYTTCVVRPACPGAAGARQPRTRLDENGHILPATWLDLYNDAHIADHPYMLENEKLRARFDPITLELTNLTDKSTGRELICGQSGYFRLLHENPRFGMTSWRVGPFMHGENLNRSCDARVTEYTRSGLHDTAAYTGWVGGYKEPMQGTEGTGLRERLCYQLRFGSSTLTAEVELKAGSDTLEYRLTADWNEKAQPGLMVPQLSFALPVSYNVARYTGDIPCGLVSRGPRPQDVPVSTFLMAEGENGSGVALVSDCKHGLRGDDNAVYAALLRTSCDPDPMPDQGVHYIRLGIACPKDAADMKRISDLFCHPVCYASNTSHPGTLPLTASALALEGENVALSCVKTAEREEAYVIRLYNLSDAPAPARLALPHALTQVWRTDSCERRLAPLPFTGSEVKVILPPLGLFTLLVK